MNLDILKKYKIKAKKNLGQNFLVDEEILLKISSFLNIENKNIVEVGPGFGALTEKIIKQKPKSLNLVELDRDMIDILEKRIENNDFDIENIDFIINNIDVLKFEPTPPPSPLPIKEGEYNYALIANIPYYITSPILRHFLYDIENPPLNMLILMQKEVAEKIVKTSPQASPFKGEGVNQSKKIKSSVLGLFIAKKSDVFYKLDVPKNSFIPAPKVDSAILLFNFNDKYKDINDNKFFKIIKLGFSSSRKKLIKNFVNAGYPKKYILNLFDNLNISIDSRAEDLDIEKWCEIVRKIEDK